MNEEIEKSIKNIQDSIEQWDAIQLQWDAFSAEDYAQEKMETAKRLQLQLTILKLIVGIESFEELPTFSRYLRNVTKYINKIDEEEEKKCR